MVHRSIDGKLAPRVVNPAGQIGRNDTNVTPGRTGIGDHGNCFWPKLERGCGSSEMRGQGRQGGAYRQRGQTDTRVVGGLMKRLSSFRASRSCLFAAGRLLASFVLAHGGRHDVLFSHFRGRNSTEDPGLCDREPHKTASLRTCKHPGGCCRVPRGITLTFAICLRRTRLAPSH
jgi:hypothetical protein